MWYCSTGDSGSAGTNLEKVAKTTKNTKKQFPLRAFQDDLLCITRENRVAKKMRYLVSAIKKIFDVLILHNIFMYYPLATSQYKQYSSLSLSFSIE